MQKMCGEAWRTIRLCVDSYEDRVLTGSFHHLGDETAHAFKSAIDFLAEAERIFDEMKYPQSFETKRSFAAARDLPARPDAEEGTNAGKRATFLIRLLFRQHASWQGTVTWVEGRGEQSFRSVLELLLLIDSALGE